MNRIHKNIWKILAIVTLAIALFGAAIGTLTYSKCVTAPIEPQLVSRVTRLLVAAIADQETLRVRGYTTQTNDIFLVEQSDTTAVFTVSNSGDIYVAAGGTFGDANLTNIGDINADSVSPDSTTLTLGETDNDPSIVTTDGGGIAVNLGGNSGDDFTVDGGALLYESDTDTFTLNQTNANDIAVFKDSGTTTFSLPDGGGALLEPAGSPTGSEGLLSYDNANSGFEKLEVYDGEHWRPVDPRTDLRDHTFIIHSGTAEYDSEFSWIPLFTHPDLGITMGGFWMAKYEMSQPTATRTDGDPIIADNGDPSTTPAVSVPGVALWDNIQFDEARKAVKNAGEEYHLCSNAEWAAAAHWAQLMDTQPYGNNNNSSSAPGDTTIDAYDCVEGGMTDKLCGTGTGPNAFSLNYAGAGPMDMNGNTWEWVDGLFMDTSGYVYVFTTTLHIDELQGVAESAASQTITDTNQSWSANELVGMYLQQGTTAIDGDWVITSNTATEITVDSASVSAAEYSIVMQVATDVTASAGASGLNILTLWNDEGDAAADDILPYQAIPRTSDGTGSATYGTDGFWYSKSAFRAAFRGGNWTDGVRSGVFALILNYAPSIASTHLSFRACRAP